MRHFIYPFLLSWMILTSLSAEPSIYLRDHLKKAKTGDYLVICHNKNYTLLLVQDKRTQSLAFEEITAPSMRIPSAFTSWRSWVEEEAPGHTAWVRYQVDLESGEMKNIYSYSLKTWCTIPTEENILSSLLNLKFKKIPDKDRRRIGSRGNTGSLDEQKLWQPRMVVDGQVIDDVKFDAWKTRWPKDGSELAGKMIEIYLPEESDIYPSYFPYWLQITGFVTKAKMRIVDSGSGLTSPKKEVHLKSEDLNSSASIKQ